MEVPLIDISIPIRKGFMQAADFFLNPPWSWMPRPQPSDGRDARASRHPIANIVELRGASENPNVWLKSNIHPTRDPLRKKIAHNAIFWPLSPGSIPVQVPGYLAKEARMTPTRWLISALALAGALTGPGAFPARAAEPSPPPGPGVTVLHLVGRAERIL